MTMTRIEQVRALADVGGDDSALVGSKAATLATLKRAGFPVLEGVVLTTEALENALTAAGLDKSARPSDIEAMPLPVEMVQARLLTQSNCSRRTGWRCVPPAWPRTCQTLRTPGSTRRC